MTNKIEEAVADFKEKFGQVLALIVNLGGTETFQDSVDGWLRTTLTSIYHAGKADKGEEVKRLVEGMRTGGSSTNSIGWDAALDNVKELI